MKINILYDEARQRRHCPSTLLEKASKCFNKGRTCKLRSKHYQAHPQVLTDGVMLFFDFNFYLHLVLVEV